MHHLRSFYKAVNIDYQNIFNTLTSNPSRVYFASGTEMPLQLYKINTANRGEISVDTHLDGVDEDLCYTYI
jgi:hypothetical protein